MYIWLCQMTDGSNQLSVMKVERSQDRNVKKAHVILLGLSYSS